MAGFEKIALVAYRVVRLRRSVDIGKDVLTVGRKRNERRKAVCADGQCTAARLGVCMKIAARSAFTQRSDLAFLDQLCDQSLRCSLAMPGCSARSSASVNPFPDVRILVSKSVVDDIADLALFEVGVAQFVKLRQSQACSWRS